MAQVIAESWGSNLLENGCQVKFLIETNPRYILYVLVILLEILPALFLTVENVDNQCRR